MKEEEKSTDNGISNSERLSPGMRCFLSTKLDSTYIHNFIISSAAAAAISWVPYEDAGGHRVPTIIFKGQPYTFKAFVVLIMFGFSTSFSALYSYKSRPKLARVLRSCSVVFLSCAGALLLFAISRGI